jgi:hypothetical protein
MAEQEFRNNSVKVGENFKAYVAHNRERAHVRVFLCGKALPNEPLTNHLQAHLRAYLWERLERELHGCQVFLGEHTNLIKQYELASGRKVADDEHTQAVNLAHFEASLAKWAHLVVIFPESPGSFAELGMFSVAPKIGRKLLLMMDSRYESHQSFINRGPVRAAEKNGARVHFVDYENTAWDSIYDKICVEIQNIFESLATESIFTMEDD